MIYLVDIDGTLANLEHRLHFIEKKPADWDGFFAACPGDELIPEVAITIRTLAKEHMIILVSGRSDAVRRETEDWMRKWSIPYQHLYMRKSGDHRADNIVKGELLDQIAEQFPLGNIIGVFEDRKQVVDMYRQRGLRVFQVAEGNF
jgi:hypothetical protein